MGLVYRLEDYARYRDAVGDATYIDITRRTDPARRPHVWRNLRDVIETYGAPWVVQMWTKNVAGTLDLGKDLVRQLRSQGTTFTAQITVTGLAGTVWEPGVPVDGLSPIPQLAKLIGGPQHIKWRYDPIIPTVHALPRFRALARQAADLGITQGVINFVAPPGRYVRVDRRLVGMIDGWSQGAPDYDDVWRRDTARELVQIADEYGIALACCAETGHLSEAVQGLGRALCGDHRWFVALSGRELARAPSSGSRRGCGCARYFDVGVYGQWSRCHRCVYCYAG